MAECKGQNRFKYRSVDVKPSVFHLNLDANIQLVKARFDAVNAHDWKRFQGLYSDLTVWSDAGLDKPIKGSTAVRKRLEAFEKGFPNFRWELDRVFGQGELMCAEFTFTGTHGGPLPFSSAKSIPVTEKSIRVQACGVYRIVESKIVESHVYFDYSRILTQLGMGPRQPRR